MITRPPAGSFGTKRVVDPMVSTGDEAGPKEETKRKSTAVRTRFGRSVREALEERKQTGSWLADRTGLSTARVEAILQGNFKRLALRDMCSIADALDRRLSDLLGSAGRPGAPREQVIARSKGSAAVDTKRD